ncbi:MAG: insulinase family protein [Anaerolineaceae bacterium]|nr:MAG: insulinase family protein [Anaerolineaceae bacterium]
MKSDRDSILQTRLRNGLEVRLKEIHTAPLISSWIWYRVGSRNEHAGITGVSHWVEHMQFKGTPTFPAGVLDRAISRDGGYWNALTWLDWTSYFETMPADRIDLALRLEADRMVHSKFSPSEVKSERTVIISERQGHENEPTFRLYEEVQAAAFRVHPYHHVVIGDMADLVTMTRDTLYEHYRRYYIPNNAVLAIAGDFRTRPMLKRIRELFGKIPRGTRLETQPRLEPEQKGERRVTVEGPGETPFLYVGYHVPPGVDSDFYPLAILDSILTGASNLNFFGAGISNKTSRLYRALVEGELAASVRGGLAATIDPYLYSINVTIRPDHTAEEALEVLDREISRLLDKPIKRQELVKAKKQARALFAYNSESITNQAFWLGFSEMFATYAWFESYLDRLVEVTSEDILEVARKYLLSSNRIVGIYRPQVDESDD